MALRRLQSQQSDFENVSGLIGWKFPPDLISLLPNLSWIQFISVSVDEWSDSSNVSPDIVVTNTKGLYADSVADYVMWSLLTLTRKFDVIIRNQRTRRWRQISGPSLRGKTLGILGMGSIGYAVAQRASAFEMKTIGVVRENGTAAQRAVVDQTEPLSRLPQFIGEIDALVVCVPATDATRGILDSTLIAKMKPGSYLISITRGGVVDELAIVEALKKGKLAGAALDSFDREPVRRWSSLWKTENLLVTPHISALTDDYRERVGNLICENVDRFSSGEALLNTIDPMKGY
jgi:phosphoglycerate dehydrogenase-like enzyme